MKFGQLIDYNMIIIVIEKWYTKYSGETSPRPFSEKLKLIISQVSRVSNFIVCFYCMLNWGAIEIYWN